MNTESMLHVSSTCDKKVLKNAAQTLKNFTAPCEHARRHNHHGIDCSL